MVNIKIPIHKRNLAVRKKSISKWKIAEEDKKDLLKFLEDLELGKVNKGNKITEARRLKYLSILKVPLEFFKKSISKLELSDVERFEKALSSGRLKTRNKTPFRDSTKADIRRMLKIYLKWKLGDNDKFRKLTNWFDMKIPTRTPDYLSEQEMIKLYKACKNAEERFLIAVLFDSGARAEEFLNIRKEDIQLPEGKDNYAKITFKDEYSKTKGRVISLYWIYSNEAIQDYFKERMQEGLKSKEQVFKNTYDNARQFLNRFGRKVLGKSIHFHLFRHSSATYYAGKINRQQLCYRYGWKFSSNMPDVYISRAGMENAELDKKFEGTELSELKHSLDKYKQENEIMKEEIDKYGNLDKKVTRIEEMLKYVKVKK